MCSQEGEAGAEGAEGEEAESGRGRDPEDADPGLLLFRGAAEPVRDVSPLCLPQGRHQTAHPVHHWHLCVPERRHCHVGHLQGVCWGGGGGSSGCV